MNFNTLSVTPVSLNAECFSRLSIITIFCIYEPRLQAAFVIDCIDYCAEFSWPVQMTFSDTDTDTEQNKQACITVVLTKTQIYCRGDK